MKNIVVPDTPALDIVNVKKIYSQWQRSGQVKDIVKNLFHPQKKEILALDSLSLRVDSGEFVAYAGANGAGKSTTIKILSGILRPTEGQVRVLGLDPAQSRMQLMKRIGVLFGQRTELWWDHPVLTSFEWKKKVWDIPDEVYRENLEMVTELLDLKELLHTFSRELSLGQRMRADLGMLLLHSPEGLFLDEPTLGLDVLAKRDMIAFLRKINAERGVTIVVTSHDMDDLEEMARRIILLDHGHLAFDGSFEDLRRQQGGLSRVRVTLEKEAAALAENQIELQGLKLAEVKAEGIVREYAFNQSECSVQNVLRALSGLQGVEDVELRHAPIEEVVANLYRSWKAKDSKEIKGVETDGA